MNADEIVRVLRSYSQSLVGYKLGCEFADAVENGASLIESLQAQLTASQRRERAAVEALKSAYIIGEANDGKLIYDAGLCSLCRKNSNELCDCPTCIGDRFEWRGKGDAE